MPREIISGSSSTNKHRLPIRYKMILREYENPGAHMAYSNVVHHPQTLPETCVRDSYSMNLCLYFPYYSRHGFIKCVCNKCCITDAFDANVSSSTSQTHFVVRLCCGVFFLQFCCSVVWLCDLGL